MLRKCLSTSMALLLLVCSLSAGEVIPGKWQKVDQLPSGTPISIKMDYGEQIECTLFDSDRDTLLIVDIGGSQRRIRKANVERVIAEKYEDSLKNGAIIGMSVGVGAALILALAPRNRTHSDRVTISVFGSVLFGLVGMGLGTLVDYEHKGRGIVYEAVKKPPSQ